MAVTSRQCHQLKKPIRVCQFPIGTSKRNSKVSTVRVSHSKQSGPVGFRIASGKLKPVVTQFLLHLVADWVTIDQESQNPDQMAVVLGSSSRSAQP